MTRSPAYHQYRYVLKKHHATHLHYDLRLEYGGVALSWALPLGPSCLIGDQREALRVQDHHVKYMTFEGVHEGKPIMLWDRGSWEPHEAYRDVAACLGKGELRFVLYGERLMGSWTLRRVRAARRSFPAVWMLQKDADSFAAEEEELPILERFPNSIESGRSLEEIQQAWTLPVKRHKDQLVLFDLAA